MGRQRAVRGTLGGLLALGLLVPPPVEAAARPVPVSGFVDDYPSVATAMRAAGTPYADWVSSGRSFLAFDPDGDGRVVEVLGDLADADRIAVLVPGVANTLRDFDRGLGGVSHRAPAAQARALYDELRGAEPGRRVAVLAWLGYDPPDGLGLAAARPASARAGVPALLGFVDVLVRHRPAASVTLIGHSYGALLLGLAGPALPPQVTALVSVGGVGMGVDRAGELGTRATVWAAEAPDDWVRRIPQVRVGDVGHGVRPAAPDFGARPLPVDRVRGHDGYLVPGTDTLHAIARVVLGTEPALAGTGAR